MSDQDVITRRSSWLAAVSVAAALGLFSVPQATAQVPAEPPSLPDVPDVRPPDVSPADANVIDGLEAQADGQADANVQADVEFEDQTGAGARADRQARLGVEIGSEEGRLRINQVTEQSAAARAGLRTGDELIAIDGERISTEAELNARLNSRVGTLLKVQNGSAYWHLFPETLQQLLSELTDDAGTAAVHRAIESKAQPVWHGPAPTEARE
jgi:membrane-associated protease RseP (regulator of RpoE activity)